MLPRLPSSFLDVKNTALELEDIQLLAESLWSVVLRTTHDLEVQVRCAVTLESALRQRKKELQLQLSWRPLYGLLRAVVADPPPKIDGERPCRASSMCAWAWFRP